MAWWSKKKPAEPAGAAEDRIRRRYKSFRELLSLNNECLEVMAGIQEDLRFVLPRRAIVGARIATLYEKSEGTVSALERLSGFAYPKLHESLQAQRNEVERYIAAREELVPSHFSYWLSEIDASSVAVAGGKAASLGEVRNKLHLPVPEGFVVTTEAYRQFCGIPLWEKIRDATHNLDLNDLTALEKISAELTAMVMALPVPRAIEVAITERARTLYEHGGGLAVRSSAVGEGGERTFAGQFLSLLNIPLEQMVEAYKRVVAGRFSVRALFYRLSAGLSEIETPIPVLCLRVIPARASGIMYTRDPANPKSDVLWITATRGLGLDIASGRMPADLFVVTRKRPHRLVEQSIVEKKEEIVLQPGGGIMRRPLAPEHAAAPSLAANELETLANWGIQIEEHFKAPQDVEWAMDDAGKIWIVQSRALALADSASVKSKSRVKQEPLLAGGRSVYPGRVSGTAHLISEPRALATTPEGAILFLRKASPEIVEVFPRIAGLVAELGNLTGHAAALLREAKIPAVFQMSGAFEKLRNGDPVSLDAVQPRVYTGSLWSPRVIENGSEALMQRQGDPISERLLTLHLLDPRGSNFRPSGCKSAHDVLRFCHEKAIDAMFEVGDSALESGAGRSSRKLLTKVPVNLYVLDLGGGLAMADPAAEEITPEEIVSRPFQALWRGITHEDVSWRREMPATLGDLASVLTTSLSAGSDASRALGDVSYLLVADEYINLNSRLAYHFSLVDACVSDTPSNNYISFRFAGGGAVYYRRHLRARFVEACLAHYGFLVDRRGDLVNAWFKKAPAAETEENLDVLGRLMACSSQLDMYMANEAVMKWYVEQFLAGNYHFRASEQPDQVSLSNP